MAWKRRTFAVHVDCLFHWKTNSLSEVATSHTNGGKDRVAVLFPDDWAAYSPTLTRLVERLGQDFEVTAFVLDTGRFDLSSLGSDFSLLRVPSRAARVLRKSGLFRPLRVLMLGLHARRTGDVRHLVAIDNDGAWAALLAGRRKFHFLSLEVRRSPLLVWLMLSRLQSIVIQTQERLIYLFGERTAKAPVFLLQNAPSLAGRKAPSGNDNISPARLVFMGNAISAHGLVPMLELARARPTIVLTLQGYLPKASRRLLDSRYADLIASGRVVLRENFLDEAAIPDFLSTFHVGLCLYELDGALARDFNYLSAPSGKMFNYFAAGIPVLGTDIPGLRPITESDAGILVPRNTTEALLQALDRILADLARFRAGAWSAARRHDFDPASAAWVDFLHACPQST
jgi:glycosyltransferase involved in cell wall biosynthesis